MANGAAVPSERSEARALELGLVNREWDIFEIAHKFMQRRDLAPTPRNYQLAYAFASGERPSLVFEIESLVISGRLLDGGAIDELFDKHLAGVPSKEVLSNAAVSIESEVAAVIAQLSGANEGVAAFSADLASAKEALKVSEGDLGDIIDSLTAALLIAEQNHRQLETHLKSSAESLRAIQARVIHAIEEAATDHLTGLATRRIFDAALKRASTDADVHGDNFAILVVDVDNFKSVNDEYGHDVGDHVLRMIANAVRAAVRRDDTACRYGGEEFAILVAGANLQLAIDIAERLRRDIERKQFASRKGEPVPKSITVSIGCAVHVPHETSRVTFRRADEALLAAKQAGKNRVFSERDFKNA